MNKREKISTIMTVVASIVLMVSNGYFLMIHQSGSAIDGMIDTAYQ